MVDGDVIGPVIPGAHLGAAEADDDADAHDAKHRKEGLPAKNRNRHVNYLKYRLLQLPKSGTEM